jgi:hypothetical protein
MHKIYKLTLAALLFWGAERLCHHCTDGFAVSKITSNQPFQTQSEEMSPEVAKIFSQKFSYLTKGGQCYVFASEDGKYVLKFFKHQHLRAPAFYSYLPFLHERLHKKRRALEKVFASCRIADEEFKEETGLVYLHLDKSHGDETLTIVDKLHIEHTLELNAFEFVLQKRATLLHPYIDTLMRNGDTEGSKRALAEVLQLTVKRTKKGIVDTDANLGTNFGFVGDKAIQIDIGRLSKVHHRGANDLKHWLNCHYPELTKPFMAYEQESLLNP